LNIFYIFTYKHFLNFLKNNSRQLSDLIIKLEYKRKTEKETKRGNQKNRNEKKKEITNKTQNQQGMGRANAATWCAARAPAPHWAAYIICGTSLRHHLADTRSPLERGS
jgi:hypothetical protein